MITMSQPPRHTDLLTRNLQNEHLNVHHRDKSKTHAITEVKNEPENLAPIIKKLDSGNDLSTNDELEEPFIKTSTPNAAKILNKKSFLYAFTKKEPGIESDNGSLSSDGDDILELLKLANNKKTRKSTQK